MAEINVVRRPPVWAWIGTVAALLLIVGLIVWGAREDRVDEAELAEGYTGPITPEPQPEGTTGTSIAPLREYLQFAGVVGEGEQPQMGREHEYTAEGLRRLAAALQFLAGADRGSIPEGAADDIRGHADRIQQEPAAAKHANAVRDALMSAAGAIESLDADRGADLRRLAGAIAPDEPLLDQSDTVREFFRRSAEAIQQASPAV